MLYYVYYIVDLDTFFICNFLFHFYFVASTYHVVLDPSLFSSFGLVLFYFIFVLLISFLYLLFILFRFFSSINSSEVAASLYAISKTRKSKFSFLFSYSFFFLQLKYSFSIIRFQLISTSPVNIFFLIF
jgi:hypothetical protein